MGKTQSNSIGLAGFILAILSLFLGWVPFLGWISWLLGAVFSFIGVFKKPKGFAIIGLVISFIGVIILILLGVGLAALGATI